MDRRIRVSDRSDCDRLTHHGATVVLEEGLLRHCDSGSFVARRWRWSVCILSPLRVEPAPMALPGVGWSEGRRPPPAA